MITEFTNVDCERKAVGADRSRRQLFIVFLLTPLSFALGPTQLRGDALVLQTLHEFSQVALYPEGDFVEVNDGSFYSMSGGPGLQEGPLVRISIDGQITPVAGFGANGGMESLFQGKDGNVYGTAYLIDPDSEIIFRLSTNGTLETLATLPRGDCDALRNSLIQGFDGNLYGTTCAGGTNDNGSIFKLSPDGTIELLFSFNGTNGTSLGNLVYGTDGTLFGTRIAPASQGSLETVFKLTADGAFNSLYSFNDGATDGGLLIQSTDGNLYGTTYAPGAATVFRLTLEGVVSTLVQFTNSFSVNVGNLIQGSGGSVFGEATVGGPSYFTNTVFRINPGGSVDTLYTNTNGVLRLFVQDRDGNLIGTDSCGGCDKLFNLILNGTLSETTLLLPSDGTGPGGLIEGSDGNIYGTTAGVFDVLLDSQVGVSGFRMSPNGTLQTLVRINGTQIAASDGSFYGTSFAESGYGSIFRMTSNGVYTTLIAFDGTNGSDPFSLVLAASGDLLMLSRTAQQDFGTVAKLAPDGKFSTLYAFRESDGGLPQLLIQARDGNLYGTTQRRPDTNFFHLVSTVFKLAPSGALTKLNSFDRRDGGSVSKLIHASDGSLYGIIMGYGPSNNTSPEEVFKIMPDGTSTNLVSFTRIVNPSGGLLEGADGVVYVWASWSDFLTGQPTGNLFRILPSGGLSLLFSFHGSRNFGLSDVIIASDGNFYGASRGGQFGGGSIFRLVHPPILTAQALPDNKLSLSWNSFSNGLYRVEYKSSLKDINWSVLTSDVTAAGIAASVTDTSSSVRERYYRVRLLP